MLSDLFSQFDPAEGVFYTFALGNGFLVFNFFLFYVLPFSVVFQQKGGYGLGWLSVMVVLYGLFWAGGSLYRYKGVSAMMGGVFCLIVFLNLSGLVPGTFSLTSHFMFSAVLSVPLWFSGVILRFSSVFFLQLGHFIGSGTPTGLSGPIALCEVVSMLMRPVALSLRLGANMLAGHVVMSLVTTCLVFSVVNFSIVPLLSFFTLSAGFFLFEGAVCVIQAYVFMMLLQLYVLEASGNC